MKYRLLVLLFAMALVLCELPPTYRDLALCSSTSSGMITAWWWLGEGLSYSSASQIAADVQTLKTMKFTGVYAADFDVFDYRYDSNPAAYDVAKVFRECELQNLGVFLCIWPSPSDNNPTVVNADPDSAQFRNSFGPHLQALANYFKQFTCFYGLALDDWGAGGPAPKVDNPVEFDQWMRQNFNIGRDYIIQYDDSWTWRSMFPPQYITSSNTCLAYYYYDMWGTAWIDAFHAAAAVNFPSHTLGYIASAWSYDWPAPPWSPQLIDAQVDACLQYQEFREFQYYAWRRGSPEGPNDIAMHPEWFTAIAAINQKIQDALGPPPETGTLKVFASYNGSYVATSVTVTGPQTVAGTTDPNNPLSFSLAVGTYVVSGTYFVPQSESVVVVKGQTSNVTLNFGGPPPPPPELPLQLIFILSAAGSVVGLVFFARRKKSRLHFSIRRQRGKHRLRLLNEA